MPLKKSLLLAGLVLMTVAWGTTPSRAAGPVDCPADRFITGVSRTGKGGACTAPPQAAGAFSVLTANVGNVDFVMCGGPLIFKLCRPNAEDVIGHNLRALSPDIVLLQEVLHPGQCKKPSAAKPGTVCHPKELARQTHRRQIDRLLGGLYDTRCTPDHYECLALKKESGWAFAGNLTVLPTPQGCDAGFSVSYADADGPGGKVRLVNGHPDSTSPSCRRRYLETIFGEVTSGAPGPVLLAGDMNLDPFFSVARKHDQPPDPDESVDAWAATVGQGKPFRYLGEDGTDPIVFTNSTGVLDHVITNHPTLSGTCTTLNGGAAPALDGGQEQMDHLAILCGLSP